MNLNYKEYKHREWVDIKDVYANNRDCRELLDLLNLVDIYAKNVVNENFSKKKIRRKLNVRSKKKYP